MLGAVQIRLAGHLPLDRGDGALAVVGMEELGPRSQAAAQWRPLVLVFAQTSRRISELALEDVVDEDIARIEARVPETEVRAGGRSLEASLRRPQLFFRLASLSDVTNGRDDQQAFGGIEGTETDLHGDERAVLALAEEVAAGSHAPRLGLLNVEVA